MIMTEVSRKTLLMLLVPMFIAGALATTLNQAVVPAQFGRGAGAGGSFHHMTPDGKIMGEYEVELPDGRTQHVTYTADHAQGYVANISYRGEATYPSGATQYTSEARHTGVHRRPSGGVLGSSSHSNSYGGRIIGNNHNKPKPRKLTPTPVTVPSFKRRSGIVISAPQYGYKARYPQPFTKITEHYDSKYNSKRPSTIQTSNKHKVNKTHEDMIQTKQPVRDQIPKTSKRFPSGPTTVPTTTPTTNHSTTTLDPYYPHYGHSAKLLKIPSRYPAKDSFPQELPTFGLVTEYKKSNSIPDKEVKKSDKEAEPLYIPKYFDFAIKRPPLPYPRI